jgi:hypothetical protein
MKWTVSGLVAGVLLVALALLPDPGAVCAVSTLHGASADVSAHTMRPGMTWRAAAGILGPAAQSPASPLTATLTMPVIPAVNQPARLDITVGSVRDAPGTTVELILPADATVVEGQSRWTLDLHPGMPQTLTTTIRFGRPGQQEVLARLRRPIDANNAWEGQGALGVTIGETTSEAGFATTAPASQQQPLTPPKTRSSAPTPPGGSSCLRLPAASALLLGSFVLARRGGHFRERR